jgi:acyl carrier protein
MRYTVMDENRIISKLKDIIINIAPEFESEEIGWSTLFVEDLYFDSLRFIEMIVEIESAFDIEIEDEYLDIAKIGVFGNLFEIVRMKFNE